MNAPSASASAAPVQSVRICSLSIAPVGTDPRDIYITDGKGTPAEVARNYRPPAAPRGKDPRDINITGGYVERGQILQADDSRRADPPAERVLTACLGPYPFNMKSK